MSKFEKGISWLSLAIAFGGLAVLAVAGLLHLLSGVDAMIAYPISVISVGFLIKEVL